MSHNVYELEKIFKKAAEYAVAEWNRPFDEAEELKQVLWVWYSESPKTQEYINSLPTPNATNVVKRAAIQQLVKMQSKYDEWSGKNPYDRENVKDHLAGDATMPYLSQIVADAWDSLAESNLGYSSALHRRYKDGEIPPQGAQHVKLVRAISALAENVNRIAITAELSKDEDGNYAVKDGPGSKGVFPETIKVKGEHGDPTANAALKLMEHPELKAGYEEVTGWNEFLKGNAATMVLDLGDGKRYRTTQYEHNTLKKFPQLVGLFIQKKSKETEC